MHSVLGLCFIAAVFGTYCLAKEIPDYIDVCKQDQKTIDACVKKSIERLRPKLAEGIPELNVPSIEPFVIPELIVDQGDLVQFKAVGRDVKVYGASDFTIKSLTVDLDTLLIRARVKFPQLRFDGQYEMDARLLVLPLHGSGNILANATKCDAEIVLKGKIKQNSDGQEYLKFVSLDMDINTKDYQIRLDGLFGGDKTLGQAANEAINQNKAEFLRSSKPYIEKTASKLLLNIANKVAGTFPLSKLLPPA